MLIERIEEPRSAKLIPAPSADRNSIGRPAHEHRISGNFECNGYSDDFDELKSAIEIP